MEDSLNSIHIIINPLSNRTTVQVKTHAQMHMKNLRSIKNKRSSLSESSCTSISDVDEMTVSTMDSSSVPSQRSVHIPVVITIEQSTLPVIDTPKLKTVLPSYYTPRSTTAAYILATLNQTFIQRNQCFK